MRLPNGVIAAIATPVTESRMPCVDRFVHHAQWLLDHGCDGLNVLGTTGEATSFSTTQRLSLMSRVAERMGAGSMMVGTGCPDLETTVELTRHAWDTGYAAALVLPPFYYKSISSDGLYNYFSALVAATADAPIPILLYNFPQMTGIVFETDLVERLATSHPARIVGAKDSSGDLGYAAQLAAIDGLAVYPSDEASLAVAAREGFSGCISATVNVSAPIAAQLWTRPDDASVLTQVRQVRSGISALPLIPAVKQMVAALHNDPTYASVLSPLSELNPAELARLPDIDQVVSATAA